jgi:KDO2-lipid IV(A) lauroyltransferase
MSKKKKKKLPSWTHGPLTAVIRGGMSLPLLAGPDAAVDAARAIGRTFGELRMNRKRLQRGIDHLGEAYPEWSLDQRREVALRSYSHLFMLGAEIAFAPRLLSTDGWTRHLRIGDISVAVRDLVADKPCVMITGHVGNWELIGYSIALLGFPIHAIYRPLDMKPLDDWVWQTRAARGLTLVSKFGAMRALPKVLQEGNPIGLVADQNGGDRGVFVPFFGRLCSTYKSIGLLAIQFGAKVICGYARRHASTNASLQHTGEFGGPGSLRYSAEVVDVFGPDDWNTHPDPLYYLTARYRRAMETMIRTVPEQYLWMHRVWRARAPHERQGKPFPKALREKLGLLPWMTGGELERVVSRSERDAGEMAKLSNGQMVK